MIKTTFLKTGKRAIKTTVLLTVFAVFSALGQTVPIDPPAGGLAIDGDLESNSPTAGVGDWVQGVAGTGGFVINNDGTVVDPTFTLFVSDAYNSGADNVFTGGSKSFQSPADWVWTNSNAIGKGDMHRAMYQLGVENPGTASAQEWIAIASDRRSTTGTSYIDFELYQKTVETTNTGGFITLGTEGGRTENDILLTIEYGSGGSVATVFFYLWKEVSPGNWDYVLQSTTSGNAFARTNSGTISMPIGSFGTPNYTARQFIEGAINLTDVFGSTSDPCIGVSFSTLLIKTKASNSRTASLNDFVEPIQVEIQFGTADIEYASTSVCESDDNITPTITGITGGTFSSSPAGLDLNTTTGEVNVANSDPGTYTITYTYVTNGCTKTAQTTLTIYENPDAPVFVENITECEADPIQTLDANDGITVPTGVSVVWYTEATGGVSVMNPTLSAVGNAIYYAEAVDDTTGCTSDTRTPVSLMILAAPDAPTSSGNITECEESPIQTLDANDAITSLPDFTVLLWYDAASGGSVVSDPTLSTVGSETYYAASVNSQTGCVSLTRTAVTLTINPAPDAPVSSGDITECEADPIQTLNANDAIVTSLTEAAPSPDFSTGGTASLVSVVWYDAATGGSVVANPILNTVGSVTYYAENTDSVTGCSSLTRTAVTLTIEPAPDAPVSSGDIIECEASPIQTLDANDAISVPGSVGYIWYDAATGGSVVAAADAVLSAVGSVTYYAEALDATTGCTSLTRTAVTLTIQAAPDAPVSSGDITECEEDPIQTLDANDAISVPGSVGYIWYDAATGGSVVAAADAVLNAVGSVTYYAEAVDATTGCTSLTRTAVTLTIQAAPDAPVSSGDITECEASPIQTLDANDAISVPGSVGYIWYDAATGGSVVTDPTLSAVGSVTFYAEAIDSVTGCISLTRTAVTLTIQAAPDAPVSSGDITECEASPIQTLDANDAISVPGSVGYIWYDAATGGSVVTDPTLSAVGSVTFYAEAIDSVTGCTSLTRTAVTLTIEPAPDAPVSSGDITECEEDPIQTLDANDAITVAAGTTVVWYDAATGGSVVADPTLSAVGSVTYYAEAVADGTDCSSLTRTAVTLTIEPAPDAPVSSGDITECEEDPIQTLDANDAITVAAGTTVVWYDAATGGSVVADPTLSAVGSVTYYAEAVADGTDCSSLTRTAVTLTIEPAPDAPVSSGDITECEEDPIQTLDANDAITVAAGTTVVWYDAATGGSVVADPTLSAVGSVTYYAEAVADGTDCSSLTRTAVTLTIEPAPDAPVSSGDITECEEDPIQTLDANDAITVAAGTTVVWYDAATGGSVVADPTLSAVGSVTYYAEAVADGTDCSSLTRTAVTLTIEPAPDAPVSSGDITECEEDPIQTLDANDAITVAAGTTVVWYDAATGGSVVADPTLSAVGSVTYYAEAVADGTDCSSLTRTAVTLTIEPAPDAPTSSGDITECEEDPIQTLDANDAITVAAGTTVVWYDAATGGSVVADPTLSAVGSVTYYAEAVADGTDCSSLTRTAVTLTIEPAPDAPTSSGDITECEEDPIQTLDANDAITVAAGTTVVWYDAATGGSVVADPTLSAVGSVTYYAEAVADGTDCSSLTRTAVTLTIEPAPDAPVSSGDITECEEDPIQTLDANDAITVAAGTTVVWYDAATGGSVVADPTLSAVGSVTYYAEVVADGTDCSSLTRTAVTLTIEPAPDAPVSSGDITECEEDPIQTLDANDAITVAAGTTVVWYDAATGGSVVADPTLSAVGSVTYYAEAVADGTDCSSLTRTAVTLTIEPAPDAPVSSGDITECEEDPIQTLDANDAITVAAGTTVVWYDAATGGSVVADPTLSAVGSVTYYAEAVADGTDCSSLTRTAVTLTIEPAPDAPVSSGDITECEEDPIQTLDANDAITVAAGTTVVWYDAATGGSVVADPTLSAVGSVTYYAEAVADGTDCSSLTRTAVTLTIEPAPDAPVSSGDITECEEDPIQTLDANDAITVAAGTTVVWYDAATGGSVVADPTLSAVGSVTYYAEAVADGTDCSSLTRTAVTLTIEPAPDAPVSSGDITECEEDPIQTLDANDAITVAAGTTVVWYDAATGGSVVADPTLSAVGSVTYYAEAVADGTDCSSLTRTAVTLTIEPAPDAPVSSGDITECEEDPIQTLDANDAITVAAGTTVVWYDAATGGSVVADPTLSAVGSVTYYAEAVADGTDCSSLTRTAVTLTIEPAPDAPVSSGDITECEEDPIQTLDANDAITVAAGTTVVWYDAATGGSVVADPTLSAVGSVTYYAEAVADGTDCSSLTRTAVTLTIEPAPDAPVSSGDITECEEDPIQTLDANDAITVAAGTTVVWYDAATGGSVVANPTLSAVGSVTYYAEAVADGTDCSSLTRTAVTLTIEPAPDAPVSSGDITECEEDPIQTLDANDAITVAAGTTVVWYDAATGGSVVADPTLSAVGSVTYYAEAVADGTDCSSLTRTAVTLTIEPAPDAPVSSGDITECEEDPIQTLNANDAITVVAGTEIVWYDAATGGSIVDNPILDTVGTVTYYAEAVDKVTGCASLSRTAVTLTILAAPDAPVSSGDITECEEDPIQTLDANDAITVGAGESVVWYDAATGGTVVADPTLSTVGSVTYYAETVDDATGCTSLERTAVTLTIQPAPDAPVSSGDITECALDPIQILNANDAITIAAGTEVVWYDAATGGAVVDNPILNAIGSVTYYVESVDKETGCTSNSRTAVTLTINDCNIALLKEGVFVDGNGSGCADEGELIEYTFTIVNTGNVPLSDVVLLDPFLGGEIPGPDSGDDNGNGLLDPDEVWIYTATYAVTLDDLNNGFVINQAEVFANGPDGLEVSDLSDPVNLDADDPTETELCQEAQFSLEKIGVFNDENGDGQPQVGETITYTFIVTNTGTVTIFGLTIEDPLPGLEVTGGPIDLPPGAVDDTTFTATYTLTEEDIENGEVRNQAFGVGTDGNGNEVRDDSDDPNDPTDDDNNGDGEPDDVTVTVLPDVLGVEFEIFNGVTPDGDGLNDFFRVLGIENFPDNNMQIFNRWGVLVYETDGYGGSDGETNVFRGRSEGRVTVRESKLLPTGTYYYVLRRFVDGETLTNSGYLYVNRK